MSEIHQIVLSSGIGFRRQPNFQMKSFKISCKF